MEIYFEGLIDEDLYGRKITGGAFTCLRVLDTLQQNNYDLKLFLVRRSPSSDRIEEKINSTLNDFKIYKEKLDIIDLPTYTFMPFKLSKKFPKLSSFLAYWDWNYYAKFIEKEMNKKGGKNLLSSLLTFFGPKSVNFKRKVKELCYIQPGPISHKEFYKDIYYKFIKRLIKIKMRNIKKLLENSQLFLIFNSNFTKKYYKKLFQLENNFKVIYPPIPNSVSNLMKMKKEKQDKITITFLTSLTAGKSLDVFIKALMKLDKKIKNNVRVIMAGYFPKEEYMQKYTLNIIRPLKHSFQKFIFKINLSDQKKCKILLESDIYIHTSSFETFGIAVLEGMAAGNAVIVHKSGAPWEDILNFGEYGLGFKDVKDLTEKINNFCENPSELNKYQNLSRKRLKYFSEINFEKKFAKVLNSFYN